MMRRLFFLASALLAAAAGTAEDAPLPIAVVDFTRAFEEHPLTAEVTADLGSKRKAARDEFKSKSNELKKILQQHQELIRAGRKSDAAEKLKEANEAEKAIATLRTTGARDLEEEFRRAKERVMNDIAEAVREFNADGAYAIVLDSSSASSNGLPQVIHAPGATDITEEIVAFVRKRHEESGQGESAN